MGGPRGAFAVSGRSGAGYGVPRRSAPPGRADAGLELRSRLRPADIFRQTLGPKRPLDRLFVGRTRSAVDDALGGGRGTGASAGGEVVGLDVKAMRTQPAETSHLHLQHSKATFFDLVDLCHSINRTEWQGYVTARDYEGLDRFIVRNLLGKD